MQPSKVIQELLEVHKGIREQAKHAAKLNQHTADIIKESIPEYQIPKISFPKIKIPDIKINYENIERIINHNSSHGWTSTQEMHFSYYLNDKLLYMNQKELDEHFMNYYEAEQQRNYYTTKDVILRNANNKWYEVLEGCFDLYEDSRYKIIIPMLISIIEGEIADISQSKNVGKNLLKDWKQVTEDNIYGISAVVSYSLYDYLRKNMFEGRDFHDDRRTMLNRNWVLHGRDDPKEWKKIDVLKLINLLSTIQFVKEAQKDLINEDSYNE